MSQRYQREIEEILGKANEDASDEASDESAGRPKRGQRTAHRAAPPRRPRRFSFSFTPGRLFQVGVVLLVVAVVVNWIDVNLMGISLAAPIAYVGVALFIIAYVSFFTRPRRTVERRWRGQVLDDPPGSGSASRLWRWITRG